MGFDWRVGILAHRVNLRSAPGTRRVALDAVSGSAASPGWLSGPICSHVSVDVVTDEDRRLHAPRGNLKSRRETEDSTAGSAPTLPANSPTLQVDTQALRVLARGSRVRSQGRRELASASRVQSQHLRVIVRTPRVPARGSRARSQVRRERSQSSRVLTRHSGLRSKGLEWAVRLTPSPPPSLRGRAAALNLRD
jgi:hypothetical protein